MTPPGQLAGRRTTPARLRAIVVDANVMTTRRLRSRLEPALDVTVASTIDSAAALASTWLADLIVMARAAPRSPDDPSLIVVVVSHEAAEARAAATVHVDKSSTLTSLAPLLVGLGRYPPRSGIDDSSP